MMNALMAPHWAPQITELDGPVQPQGSKKKIVRAYGPTKKSIRVQ